MADSIKKIRHSGSAPTAGERTRKGRGKDKPESGKTLCINKECKLRQGGCKGFDGCPGYITI